MYFSILIFSTLIKIKIVVFTITITNDISFLVIFIEIRIKIKNKNKNTFVITFSEIVKTREKKITIARIVIITTITIIINILIALKGTKNLARNTRKFLISREIELNLENKKLIFKRILKSILDNFSRRNTKSTLLKII